MRTKASQYIVIAILTFLVVTLIAVIFGITSLTQKQALAQATEPTIITENGFKVVRTMTQNVKQSLQQ